MLLLLHAIIPCFAAWTTLFGTSIPTSFSILNEKFLHLFHWFLQIHVLTSPTPFYSHMLEPRLSMKRGMRVHKYKMASNSSQFIYFDSFGQ